MFVMLNELAELLIPGVVVDEIAAAFGSRGMAKAVRMN